MPIEHSPASVAPPMVHDDARSKKPRWIKAINPSLIKEPLNRVTNAFSMRPRPAASHEVEHTTCAYWNEKILGALEDGQKREETLDYQQQLIRQEVAEFIDEGDDTVEEKIEKQRAKERAKEATPLQVTNMLNPMAVALGPVQCLLRELIPKLRLVRNV